ncbi:MAG: sodium-dependent bicarbonate transport family permease [Actinobacteria bacterium]|nr:sodium-dependent bicarbonate transport family permease [Actinomycetota bacterium]
MIAASLADSLLTAPVIAFLVALVATLAKFEVRLPESLYPILSTFLLLAIGLKGGKALAAASPGDIWKPLVASLVLGVVTPLVAFTLFRILNKLDTVNSAALAAHYGSVSAVTFTVLLSSLDTRGIDYEGFVAGLLAVLEIVGIIVALFLARGSSSGDGWKSALGEVVRGRSIALLVTGLVVGAVVGADRMAPTDPLFVGLFAGALTLFLIEMGVIAAERLRDISSAGWRMVALGVLIPLVNGLLGALLGTAAGLSTGGVAVMATLAGSASYIAAPAAVRIALPQASPGLYVTASLGVTFPFNLTLGIPYYIALAQALT